MFRCTATHTHAKIVARQVCTMEYSVRQVWISSHDLVIVTVVRFIVVDSAEVAGACSTDVMFTARELTVSMDGKARRMARSVDIFVDSYRSASTGCLLRLHQAHSPASRTSPHLLAIAVERT